MHVREASRPAELITALAAGSRRRVPFSSTPAALPRPLCAPSRRDARPQRGAYSPLRPLRRRSAATLAPSRMGRHRPASAGVAAFLIDMAWIFGISSFSAAFTCGGGRGRGVVWLEPAARPVRGGLLWQHDGVGGGRGGPANAPAGAWRAASGPRTRC